MASGPALDLPGTTLTRAFPTAQHLVDDAERFLPGRSPCDGILRSVATRLADGSLEVGVGSDVATLRAALLDVDGVSPGTADYVTMRVLGHPDVQLPSEATVLDAPPGMVDQEVTSATAPSAAGPALSALDAAMAAVRPWRSYASMHLRRAAAPASSREPTGRDAA